MPVILASVRPIFKVTTESGATETAKLATPQRDGPNGTFSNADGTVTW